MVMRNPYVILGLVIILFFILIALYKMPEGKDRTEIESIQKTFKILLKNKVIFSV